MYMRRYERVQDIFQVRISPRNQCQAKPNQFHSQSMSILRQVQAGIAHRRTATQTTQANQMFLYYVRQFIFIDFFRIIVTDTNYKTVNQPITKGSQHYPPVAVIC